MNPILSVIIVAYKSKDEIYACLASIPRSLNGRNVEVIVFDNASADDVGELILSKFPTVAYIESQKNVGFAKANNLAFERASGEFVLFLNPDTISNEEAYIHCLERLRRDPSIGIISPRLVLLNGEMDLACRRSIPTVWDGLCRVLGLAQMFPKFRLFAGYNLTYLADNGTYDVGSVNGAFMMASRSALLRVGLFDEQFFMYGDDLDLNFRFRQAGYRVVYDGSREIVHLKGASSSQAVESMAKAVFVGTMQFYNKHFNPRRAWLVTWKYRFLFGAWEKLSRFRAYLKGYKKARPL